MIDAAIWDIGYLVAALLFILGLKKLGHPRTAPTGNLYGASGMLLAVAVTLARMSETGILGWELIVGGLALGALIGTWMALRVEMTGMPEMVALFNGFGGGASALVALSEVLGRLAEGNIPEGVPLYATWIAIGLSGLVGWITLSGSLVAMMKLKGGFSLPGGKWVRFPTWGPPWLNVVKVLLLIASFGFIWLSIQEPTNVQWIYGLIGCASLLGILFVLPIGGADMPVVVSLLNSLSGIAAAFTGFVLMNNVLIIAGSMVGAAGLILTFIMCKAMNRELRDVLFKAFGGSGDRETVTRTKVGSDPEEVVMLCDGISKCIIVPGYGMAVSQCQHQVREFAEILEARDCEVKYGIHPVAGRMPGHMNVLLAEANVPYEQLIELEHINSEFADTDVVLVVGANDTVNPAARSGKGPLAGMPILDVDKARVVVMVKRSLSVGYAGVDNDLFYEDNTMMLFGDGKEMMTQLVQAMKEL
ncbi:MAG: NAD(P)(+) transhydrogenase (Re/Si-specific) subunit beta [Candidatus Poseidoniia archaeon]|nr:NAD(P)(+) transhydrogenase (Re/Si-specific) subunit beta [Candidatus Poseidoniia archaeon]MDP7136164.1 NAD(P)(+) transhydrogenase (Re/Si-specific) subunit beta [Candidatus Poseidoniia archaeon]MDP7243255.1 NAD(P)(+) transhydrogenase (Re/Si-specific) subunit beta [Candidatus Poseidoniia archaeon]MDP7535684.1 NAD(P)(+) transhydrogenase (Re/Si-specific) subunit beta [Candidatus Poseidoniia archaeon]MDP7590281.1 NAD(P)(+) transhydrogenase (Re/Si-specific) subunit beta [Candidatus Poseidoniia arc